MGIIMDNNHKNKRITTRKLALMGLLFALAMVFSFIESLLPPMPAGIKLGLANIVTMYALFFLGYKEGITIVILKSLFVFLTRGATAFIMSIFGGFASVLVMILLFSFKKLNLSYLIISLAGGVFHNLGQLVAAYFILKLPAVFYYLPIMVASGVVMGVVTGITLKVVMPYMNKLKL